MRIVGGIVVPRSMRRRTSTERLREELGRRHALIPVEDREIRLPFVGLEPYGAGSPSGAFTIRTGRRVR